MFFSRNGLKSYYSSHEPFTKVDKDAFSLWEFLDHRLPEEGFTNLICNYSREGWTFDICRSGIIPSADIEKVGEELGLRLMPSLYYGFSTVKIANPAKNVELEITPRQALRVVNFHQRDKHFLDPKDIKPESEMPCEAVFLIPGEVKIRHHQNWKNKKLDQGIQISEIKPVGDCFLTTPYRGNAKGFRSFATEQRVPLHLLGEDNPILWSAQTILYEDELDDNGLSKLEFRFRVMGDSFFGLLRFYLRVDEVLLRIYDTRIYHAFGSSYVLREFTVKENSWAEVKARGFVHSNAPNQSFAAAPLMDTRLCLSDRLQMPQ